MPFNLSKVWPRSGFSDVLCVMMLRLESLSKKYGILVVNRRLALGDAYIKAELFDHLVSQLEKRGITWL